MDPVLPANLQHSILAVLLFDQERSRIIRNSLPIEVWGTDYCISSFVKKIYHFIDTYKKAPDQHIVDLVGEMSLKPEQQDLLLLFLDRATKSYEQNLNFEYLMDQVNKFQRQANLRMGIQKSAEMMEQGRLDEAEEVLNKALRKRIELFDQGITVHGGIEYLKAQFENQNKDDKVRIAIPALDDRGIVPTRKELYLLVAAAKKGKTHFLVHCGKEAILQGKRVLHLSLEVADKIVAVRYLQSLLCMSRYRIENQLETKLLNGQIWREQRYTPVITDNLNEVEKQLQFMEEPIQKLLIKEFPSGSLTISALRGYLQALQVHSDFTPDVLILDYADLMKIKDIGNKRVELGQIYVELRGLAAEFNMAVVTCTQTNRGGADAKVVETTDIAEDWSKVATADNILTYSQTKEEKSLGVARINVAACRNNEDRFQILITQDYTTSRFAIDSVELTEEWRQRLDEHTRPQ